MPNTPPGATSAGTIRSLGLPRRAVTALSRAGVTSIDDLAALTRRDLAGIPALGPGMIAAIRLVVPEPRTGVVRPASGPDPDPEEESPAAPSIPSFASLRAPRRRTAVDVLMPGSPSVPSPVPTAPRPAPAPAARPAEYADLVRLGVHVVRALAGVPLRVAEWAVREPIHHLRRLLGG